MIDYGLLGKLSTEPHDREALVSILTEGVEIMRAAPGCHTYIVTKDANDEGTVWVIELWESKEAHDQSLTLPGVQELIARAMPLLKGRPQGITVIPVSGKGL